MIFRAHPDRSRRLYAMMTIFVIALGLASRKFYGIFPPVIEKYPGDVLWALMVFLFLGIVLRNSPTVTLAGLALGISYLDEFSQLYQAPWINSIRDTFWGHLMLGSRFSWFDIFAYSIGITIGIVLELIIFYWQKTKSATDVSDSIKNSH